MPLRGEKVNFEGASGNGSHEVKPPPQAGKTRASRNGATASSVLPENIYNGTERSLTNV